MVPYQEALDEIWQSAKDVDVYHKISVTICLHPRNCPIEIFCGHLTERQVNLLVTALVNRYNWSWVDEARDGLYLAESKTRALVRIY